jgi:hypothetical protein
MLFADFCKYYEQLHYCVLKSNKKYVWENITTSSKNGSIYELTPFNDGTYYLSVNQQDVYEKNKYLRVTLLLVRINDLDHQNSKY